MSVGVLVIFWVESYTFLATNFKSISDLLVENMVV